MNMPYFRLLPILLLSLLTALIIILGSNIGDPTRDTIETTHHIPLETSYLPDQGAQLNFEQVTESDDKFIKAPLNSIPWSFGPHAYWIKIGLKNNTNQDLDLTAHFDNPMLDEIDVYQLSEKGLLIKNSILGERRQLSHIDDYALPHFNFLLAQQRHNTLFIRIRTSGIANTPIKIYGDAQFANLTRKINLVWGGFVGVLLMMAIYNLVLYLGVKEGVYLLYVGYIISALIMMGVVMGFGGYLWPMPVQEFFQLHIIAANCMTALFTLLFLLYFLQYNKTSKWLFRLGISYGLLLSVFLLWSLFIPEYQAAPVLFLILDGLYIIAVTLVVIKIFRGFKWARFYFISWLPLLAGAIAEPLMLTGVIDYSFLSRHAFMLGAGAEIALMAMALADRMRNQKEQVIYNATHELSSGLPNYSLLENKITHNIDIQHDFALCVIEINNFGSIAPYLSNEESNQLVSLVVKDLESAIAGDAQFLSLETVNGIEVKVAKLRDGFVAILVRNLTEKEQFNKILNRVRNSLVTESQLSGFTVDLTTIMGICQHSPESRRAGEMVKNAFQALEQSKSEHRHYSYYNNNSNYFRDHNLALARDLQHALEQDLLELYHQPQIELATRSVYGSEVLLRWRHPSYGYIPPDIFIRIAEDTGLITRLTRWVVKKALTQQEQLIELGYDNHKLSINISGKDVQYDNFVNSMITIFALHKVPYELINIELTESVMVTDFALLSGLIFSLSELGINTSIDDYGTGYSSLSYLSQLPFDELKLDKSFISDLPSSQRNLTIVKNTINMAKILGLSVVAEGIEDAETEHQLIRCECDIGQGYYYSKPLPLEDYIKWLAQYDLAARDKASKLSSDCL